MPCRKYRGADLFSSTRFYGDRFEYHSNAMLGETREEGQGGRCAAQWAEVAHNRGRLNTRANSPSNTSTRPDTRDTMDENAPFAHLDCCSIFAVGGGKGPTTTAAGTTSPLANVRSSNRAGEDYTAYSTVPSIEQRPSFYTEPTTAEPPGRNDAAQETAGSRELFRGKQEYKKKTKKRKLLIWLVVVSHVAAITGGVMLGMKYWASSSTAANQMAPAGDEGEGEGGGDDAEGDEDCEGVEVRLSGGGSRSRSGRGGPSTGPTSWPAAGSREFETNSPASRHDASGSGGSTRSHPSGKAGKLELTNEQRDGADKTAKRPTRMRRRRLQELDAVPFQFEDNDDGEVDDGWVFDVDGRDAGPSRSLDDDDNDVALFVFSDDGDGHRAESEGDGETPGTGSAAHGPDEGRSTRGSADETHDAHAARGGEGPGGSASESIDEPGSDEGGPSLGRTSADDEGPDGRDPKTEHDADGSSGGGEPSTGRVADGFGEGGSSSEPPDGPTEHVADGSGEVGSASESSDGSRKSADEGRGGSDPGTEHAAPSEESSGENGPMMEHTARSSGKSRSASSDGGDSMTENTAQGSDDQSRSISKSSDESQGGSGPKVEHAEYGSGESRSASGRSENNSDGSEDSTTVRRTHGSKSRSNDSEESRGASGATARKKCSRTSSPSAHGNKQMMMPPQPHDARDPTRRPSLRPQHGGWPHTHAPHTHGPHGHGPAERPPPAGEAPAVPSPGPTLPEESWIEYITAQGTPTGRPSSVPPAPSVPPPSPAGPSGQPSPVGTEEESAVASPAAEEEEGEEGKEEEDAIDETPRGAKDATGPSDFSVDDGDAGDGADWAEDFRWAEDRLPMSMPGIEKELEDDETANGDAGHAFPSRLSPELSGRPSKRPSASNRLSASGRLSAPPSSPGPSGRPSPGPSSRPNARPSERPSMLDRAYIQRSSPGPTGRPSPGPSSRPGARPSERQFASKATAIAKTASTSNGNDDDDSYDASATATATATAGQLASPSPPGRPSRGRSEASDLRKGSKASPSKGSSHRHREGRGDARGPA